jgi:Uma2 family endonuclease
MVANPIPQYPRMSEDEYLAFERASEHKHELLYGEVVAMVGASERHVLIQGALHAALYTSLRKRGCKAYLSDMKVRIPNGNYVYPDLTLVCGASEFQDTRQDVLLNPLIVVEILSVSTEAYDRGLKFQHYRGVASIAEVVFIAQDRPLVERHVRNADGTWTMHESNALDAVLTLAGVTLPLAEIYADISFGE